jgi:N6-L-threonylcarbamoyladenine synthase
MIILGIETSFDETSAAIVHDGTTAKHQFFSTSIEKHRDTGGVVPEVASREQALYIIPVLQQVFKQASSFKRPVSSSSHLGAGHSTPDTLPDIDAIAVTIGPGLIGSLLLGVETAKALALAWNKPLIPVNHMLGHIYGAWLTYGEQMNEAWPKLAVLVSGAHTELILMKSHAELYKVGWTLDDAAGEAFDKVARLLGFPYPGGPHLSKLATEGDPLAINFPLPLNQKNNSNFSFSGLKTAVLNYVRENPQASNADIAASFQRTVVTSIVNKTKQAAEQFGAKEIILGGGVAANKLLRQRLPEALDTLPVRIPDFEYTTDNAAVIAAAAFYHQDFVDPLTVQADPSLELPTKG